MNWKDLRGYIRTRFDEQVAAAYPGSDPQIAGSTTSVAAADDSFNDATEDLSVFIPGSKVLVAGFTEAANNGHFTVKASAVDKLEIVEDVLADEALGDAITIKTALAVQYDNDDSFSKPNDKIWVRFTIRPGQDFQVTLGATKRFRSPGVAIAQIFQSAGVGDEDTTVLADIIRLVFLSTKADGVTYRTPYEGEPRRDERDWQTNVYIPYYADDVR